MKRSIAQSIRWKMDNGEPLFAVVYARTSTLNDEQKDSCDNQVAMARMFLQKNPNIILAEEPYVDQGISGKSNLHRVQYEQMLERIRKGDIDLLIVKTKARLCRSKAISAILEEMMRDYKFSIFTLSDGQLYDSTDRSSRLINGIKDVIDEDYVWGQSEYGKLTHQLRCQKKILTNNVTVYGYRWNKEKRDMEIIPEEAAMIKKMFEWYVYENLGVSEISRRMALNGAYGKNNGKRISVRCIVNWLENEAYAGTFYINKKGSELELGNNRETKRFNLPREEWIAIPRPDLAIIDKELYDLAQRIRETRKTVYEPADGNVPQARFTGHSLFASKVFCGECGTAFVHLFADRKKQISVYKDRFKWKSHVDEYCENKRFYRIFEATLTEITKEAINRTVSHREEIFDYLSRALVESFSIVETKKEDEPKIPIDDNRILNLEQEKKSYFESWRTAPNEEMKSYFYGKIQEITRKISEENQKEKAQVKRPVVVIPLSQRIEAALESLNSLRHVEEIDRNIVESFVHKIIVYKDGKIQIILKSGHNYETQIEAEEAQKSPKKSMRLTKTLFFKENVAKMDICRTTV